ncbi:MAG: AraC family transcriptional regulator [Mucilaginibacter sp.]|nr:AraC family transcriptional regulator [Mucilaginibacter sp.]
MFDVFVVFGILQGLVCSILLLIFKSKNVSKRLLAFVLLVFILLSFKIEIHTLGLWQTNFFRYFPLAVDLAIQPLTYIYVVAITQNLTKLHLKDLFHFIPAFIFIIHAVVVYLVVYPQAEPLVKDRLAEQLHFNVIKAIEDYLSIISAFVYWFLSYKCISNYRRLFNQTSNACYPSFSWLKNILIAVGVLIVALTVNIILDSVFHFGYNHFFHWQVFYIFLSLLIYYLGFAGYYQPDFKSAPDNVMPDYRKAFHFQRAEIESAKVIIIRELETNKIYLDQDISINSLANKAKISAALISATINREFGKNFRNLVNEYRIEEVKEKLLNPKFSHLSILGVALESGFNSEASFYRSFKKHTGISPSDYLNSTKTNQLKTVLKSV